MFIRDIFWNNLFSLGTKSIAYFRLLWTYGFKGCYTLCNGHQLWDIFCLVLYFSFKVSICNILGLVLRNYYCTVSHLIINYGFCRCTCHKHRFVGCGCDSRFYRFILGFDVCNVFYFFLVRCFGNVSWNGFRLKQCMEFCMIRRGINRFCDVLGISCSLINWDLKNDKFKFWN